MAIPFTLLTCGYVFGIVLLFGSAVINLLAAVALAQVHVFTHARCSVEKGEREPR